MRRIAGAAGLAYAVGVSIENQDVLEAPALGDSAAEIRANYADQAFGVVTTFAGVLALVAYVVFAVTLFAVVRGADRRAEGWALAGLAGGLAGPVLAATGAAASTILVARAGTGPSDELTRILFDYHLVAQMTAGVFVALFLAGIGVAALRTATLPAPLAWAGIGIGAMIVFAPLAALTDDHSLQVAVTILFGLDTLWVFAVGLWLALGDGFPVRVFARRVAFLLLAIAAGLVGVALIAAPGATGKFFAWGLGPEPLAAFAGGVYVGSAVLYAVALPRRWREVQSLVAGAALLSVSVFAVTLTHEDQFDFGRLQAWAWVVLFAGFALLMLWLLLAGATDDDVRPLAPLPPWARAALALTSAFLAALALALWVDPAGLSDSSPFTLPPLGGRFAGSWIALLALLTGWAAARNSREEAWLPALGLVTLPAGALIAALRTLGDHDPAAPLVAALVVLIAIGGATTRASRASARRPRPAARPARSARS
jgi:hypothetical protein